MQTREWWSLGRDCWERQLHMHSFHWRTSPQRLNVMNFCLSLDMCVGHNQWEQSMKREPPTLFRRSQVVECVWSNWWLQETRLEKRPQSPPTAESLWNIQEPLTSEIHAALQEVRGKGKKLQLTVPAGPCLGWGAQAFPLLIGTKPSLFSLAHLLVSSLFLFNIYLHFLCSPIYILLSIIYLSPSFHRCVFQHYSLKWLILFQVSTFWTHFPLCVCVWRSAYLS